MRGRVAQVALWIDLNGRHSEASLSNIAHFRAFSEGRSAVQQSTASIAAAASRCDLIMKLCYSAAASSAPRSVIPRCDQARLSVGPGVPGALQIVTTAREAQHAD